jgi:hypothetical protein
MNTYTETVKLPHGYTATIAIDEDPINPFSKDHGDCEPPIAVLNLEGRGAIDNYDGEELNLKTLLDLIPADKWTSREGKREILKALPFATVEMFPGHHASGIDTLRDAIREYGDFRSAIEGLVYDLDPSGWSEWQEYFDAMAAVASIAGIPCHNTTSHGHCQGDVALVFVLATPAWAERVGAPTETLERQCEGAADLWSAWAWGDCYGIEAIHRPDDTEVEDASLWGFYGDDHKESGIIDAATDAVISDMKHLEREAQAAHEAACRDIATV